MKRTEPTEMLLCNSQDFAKRIAFHEAGHAAGIHLYNRQQSLPSVFFQIRIEPHSALATDAWLRDRFLAGVENGYLIDNLPVTLIESASYFTADGLDAYQAAFEADMTNLLVGALAEAKYVAMSHGKLFDPVEVNIETLLAHGGSSDLSKVYNYLERFIASKNERDKKIEHLLGKALAFIDHHQNWQAIERLANFLLTCHQDTISCEDAISVLDSNAVCKSVQ